MQIQEFSFKNICSYGNKLQTLKFTNEPRLILVQGVNGSGKSSISDALTVSIYGKSAIRKIKEIPNRINKNAYTQVKFKTSSGKTVEIERGIEPNFSRVLINGSEYNLPDKRRVDEFIEDELTKIAFNVFSNTISLSVNDFKSFVKLSPTDKRQIIDKIFGLDIVNDMAKISKAEIKQIRDEMFPIESSLATNERMLASSLSQLELLKTEIATNNDSRIEQIRESIRSLETTKNETKTLANSFVPEITEIKTKINDLRQSQSTVRANISELQRKLELYSKNKCPHCLSDLTDSIHIQLKERIQAAKTLSEEKIPKFTEQILESEKTLQKLEDSRSNASRSLYSIDAEISPLIRELQTLQKEVKTSGTDHLSEVIKKIQEEITINQNSIAECKERLKVAQELESILGDSGMKRMLMSQIVPLLNKRILKTAKVLEFKFAFEFDLEFNPIITHLGMQISPDSLSTGEQKKMNLIVLLAIIELIKMKHNNVNILFLDEIFSSLDVGSIYRVVDLLKAFAKQYNMTVFVISHDPLPEEYFDLKLQIENADHFSDIRVI